MSGEHGHHLMPETKPGVAVAEQGYVVLEGPDSVAVTMTADAAERTGEALIAAAAAARAQGPSAPAAP